MHRLASPPPRPLPAWLAVIGSFALMMVLAGVLCAFGTVATLVMLDGSGTSTPPSAAITGAR